MNLLNDITLLPKQEEAFYAAKDKPKFALFMKARTGKTVVGSNLITYRAKEYGAKTFLILTVKAGIEVWKNAFNNWIPYATKGYVNLIPEEMEPSYLNVVIMNYEQTINREWELNQIKWDMIILDECHKLKSQSSKSSEACRRICKDSPNVLIMTGTPIDKKIDLFQQFRFIDPEILGKTMKEFENRWCKTRSIPIRFKNKQGNLIRRFKNKVVGYKNEEEFAEAISPYIFQANRSDVMKVYEHTEIFVEVNLPPRVRSQYKLMFHDLVTVSGNTIISVDHVMSKVSKCLQISSGFIYDKNKRGIHIHGKRLNTLHRILTRTLAQSKTVIFCRYSYEIEAIKNKLGSRALLLTADMSSTKRNDIVRQYWKSKEPLALVCNPKVGGIAIRMDCAAAAIFYSMSYSGIDNEQALSRLYNVDRKSKPLVIYLYSKGTLDWQIIKLVKDKANVDRELFTRLRNDDNIIPGP